MSGPRLLRISVVYVPALILIGLLLPYLLFWSRFPDPMATHWSGQPNGSLPRWLALSAAAAVWVGLVGWEARRSLAAGRDDKSRLAPGLTAIYSVAGVLLFANATIAWANLDVGHWTEARNLDTFLTIIGVLGAAALLAAAGYGLERRLDAGGPSAQATAALELGPSERAAWFGRASNPWSMLTSLGIAAFVFFATPSSSDSVIATVLALVVAVLGLGFESVHVSANTDQVTVALGPWRWPRRTISTRDITSVEVMEVRPMKLGGWGLRSCGRGCRAYVIRAGDGLVIHHQSQKTIVTVNGASEGAALIEALRTRV